MKDNAAREWNDVPPHWEVLLYPLLFGLALLLRAQQLNAFITWDEPAWAYRCVRFYQALAGRALDQAAWSDPTGTVTLWAGSLVLALRTLLEGAYPASGWEALAGATVFDPQNAALVRQVAYIWPTLTWGIAVLSAALAALIAFLAARLWGWRAGLFAGLLLAVSPWFLAHSRVLGPDALTAGLAVGAVLALLWGLRKAGSWAPFLLSGVLGGLAVLNQGEAAIVVPYALLILALGHLIGRRPALAWLGSTVLWCIAFAAAAGLAYPQTWVAPLAAAQELLASLAGSRPALLTPSATYSALLTLGLHLMPLSGAGLALVILRLPFDGARRRFATFAVLAFALAAWGLGGAVGPDGPQALMAIVALEVAAAAGLDGLATTAPRLLPPQRRALATGLGLVLTVAVLGAIGWQAAGVILYCPYYPSYRNPWLAARAPTEVWAGWGQGMDRVADYLNAQPDAPSLRVATPDVALLSPLFVGETLPLTADTALTADLVVVYNRDWLQPNPVLARVPPGPPEEAVRLFGVEYARIYANRAHEPIVEYLSGRVHADDIVILDAQSPFGHDYQGPAPYKEIAVQSAEQVAAELGDAAPGRWRLWYVAFENADPGGIVSDLLQSHAMLLGREDVAGATISAYLLPLQPRFNPLVPDQAVGLEFPEGLSLQRAGLAETRVQYRQKIALALEWQTRSEPTGNIAISLRLLDEQGRQWAHEDSWIIDPQGRSTAAWSRGETLRSVHTLAVPAAAPPGSYRLRMILYRSDSLQPLVPTDASGPRSSAEVDLATVEVVPAQMPPAVEELKLAHPIRAALAYGMELLACEMRAEAIQPGQELPIRLWWRATEPMTMTYRAHLMLLDAGGDLRAEGVVELAGPQHPTTTWSQGEIIEGRYSLALSSEAVDGEAIVGVELTTPRGRAGDPVRLGAVQVNAPEHVFDPPPMQQRRGETLGEAVRLLGYDLDRATLRPGDTLRLTLYWQCLAPMQTSYTVFTHLLDGNGQLFCGHDAVPAQGARPTLGWVLHEILTDAHDIAIPADAQPGRYSIEVGLYDAATNTRLPAHSAAGTALPQDRILLGTITVE